MAGDGQERGSAGLDQTPAAIAPRATTLAMFLCNSNRGVLGWHAGAGAYKWPVPLTVSQARTECLCSLQPGVGTEHSCTPDTLEAWAWLPLDALPAPEPFLLYGYLVPLGRLPWKGMSVSTFLPPKAANTNMTLISRGVFFLLLHQNLHIS